MANARNLRCVGGPCNGMKVVMDDPHEGRRHVMEKASMRFRGAYDLNHPVMAAPIFKTIVYEVKRIPSPWENGKKIGEDTYYLGVPGRAWWEDVQKAFSA